MTGANKRNRRVLVVLLAIVIGMFVFGFVLIPIYRVMSNVYGFGGQTHRPDSDELARRQAHALRAGVDRTRSIALQFIVTDSSALELEFRPLTSHMKVNPGEVKEVIYYVRNLSGRKLELRALPSVSPDAATRYLVSIESFCCKRMVLDAGEAKEMPVKFVIDPDIPRTMQVLTLSFRFIMQTHADTGRIKNVRMPHGAVIAAGIELI